VVNPVSGRRKGEQTFELVRPMFEAANVHFTVIKSSARGDIGKFILEAEKLWLCSLDVIIAIGGDGTLNEVVTALLERPDCHETKFTPLAMIPAGTEGAFARTTSVMDPVTAAYAILKAHEIRFMDVLQLTQQHRTFYAVCGVGWGIPGVVAGDSERLRETFGVSRYAVSVLRQVLRCVSHLIGAGGQLERFPCAAFRRSRVEEQHAALSCRLRCLHGSPCGTARG